MYERAYHSQTGSVMESSSARCVSLPGRVDLLALHRHDPHRYPFLLQSAVADQQRPATARYDLLFAFPGKQYALWSNNRITCNGHVVQQGDFLACLDQLWRQESRSFDGQGLPFQGGWFVYLGYELAQQIEPRLRLPIDTTQPIASVTRIPAAVIVDHFEHMTWLVVEPEYAGYLEPLQHDITTVTQRNTVEEMLSPLHVELHEEEPQRYLDAVSKVKHYIVEGDVFQVNLSRGWQADLQQQRSPADIYQHLCQTNPAPFAGLACFDEFAVISSSPERLVKVHDETIETRPIAGTRPRDSQASMDEAYKQELIGHPKERAEHIMLIDLERNDLGRVCQPGSIEVNEMMVLESYAHVHHIVSNVRGSLRAGITPGDIMRAVFPGGTITGCPKERCMAIIAELEQTPRGAYTGSMGYLNHDGSMDLNILIRTLTLQDRHISLRAGAGLVMDSVAEQELQETRHKARGLLLALEAE